MLMIGWQEWVSLPTLGLLAIKAKADTGAKTSALHAEDIVTHGDGAGATVTFVVRPARRRPSLTIAARASLIDVRDVTSSSGTVERRPVITASLSIGEHSVPIEISLTDRRDLSARMLLGRQALAALDATIDPGRTFLMPTLGYKLYPGWKAAGPSTPRGGKPDPGRQ